MGQNDGTLKAKQNATRVGSSAGCGHTYIYFFLTLVLSSFWTSRGHRCRPFSPPILLAFNFYRAQGSAIPLLVDFSIECR